MVREDENLHERLLDTPHPRSGRKQVDRFCVAICHLRSVDEVLDEGFVEISRFGIPIIPVLEITPLLSFPLNPSCQQLVEATESLDDLFTKWKYVEKICQSVEKN